ncbi:hypothetical protein TNCV_41621 [Trichonephila clavipes]|nr:hypothetical protein TNCV_41621 [Trichonephila clavipes]
MADVQDLKSALKLEAATQASRRLRHSIRGARVTADVPCESPWIKEIEGGYPSFNGSMSEPRETQLQVLRMRWNGAPENKLSPSKEEKEPHLFFKTGKLEYAISRCVGRQIMKSPITRFSRLLQ